MVKTHNLGFPRIGGKRELKFALESYWQGSTNKEELLAKASEIRGENWQHQTSLDYVPLGDFSLYDHILDTSFLFGNLPVRLSNIDGKGFADDDLDNYFRVARGRSLNSENDKSIHAGEMTKWFDTNYHYIVPEVTSDTHFHLKPSRLLSQIEDAKRQNVNFKPVIVGPLTYLYLSKEKDDSNKLDLLERLLPEYHKLFQELKAAGSEWIQIDEPILVTEIDSQWRSAFENTYAQFSECPVKLLLTTYFGDLQENLSLAINLPTAGIHIDAINCETPLSDIVDKLPKEKVLSLGVLNGRNIWKQNLEEILTILEPIANKIPGRLWIAPSCSLLHVPIDLDIEDGFDSEIKSWLSFALQKVKDISTLAKALNHGRDSVANQLAENVYATQSRKQANRVHNAAVKKSVQDINEELGKRKSPYSSRSLVQRAILNLPDFPTTTIGSFPQTKEIRSARLQFKNGEIDQQEYNQLMREEIERAVEEQEKLNIDVLVHGEAERNDMVEYFGERLEGFIFSRFAWVQSYGSRCVKPPILFGDISLEKPMTVEWSQYAQSLTDKPMKAMLTGPVTILNWSFVRDDQGRSETCRQLALAIRKEVLALEASGIKIIQIDEAALREGLPLRKAEWKAYLDWAIDCFCLSANGVDDKTQIHTHMCYSEFNDIIEAIAKMDADVITIETSRSDMELLEVFDDFNYPNEIGPGVYDIHSPNIPSKEQIVSLMEKAAKKIPKDRLWINPDCGLKTRRWEEVIPALKNMVDAAKILRQSWVS